MTTLEILNDENLYLKESLIFIFQSALTVENLDKAEILQSRLLTIGERLNSMQIKLKYLHSEVLVQKQAGFEHATRSTVRQHYLDDEIEDIKLSILNLKQEISLFKTKYLSG
jgi:hypothetical protein